ncbi:tannase and feruloyl esterase [Cadophora sp. DSE1049]|nr:tannase and feruloyl esterase [Cadophora sp. DSE1049]
MDKHFFLNADVPGLNFCDVTLKIKQEGSDKVTKISVWLPLHDWNGRFQATGGGGFLTGVFESMLGIAVGQGYATAATDGGHGYNPIDPSEWLLSKQGTIEWDNLHDFSTRALHYMVLVGKAVTKEFYGTPAHHTYWNGCSSGGRQGYALAQRYPEDFDGILASAPAMHFPQTQLASYWPQVVMQVSKTFPSNCEFNHFRQEAIRLCDGRDGVEDGIVAEPYTCDFDPFKLVGEVISCDGVQVTISNATANVVHRVIDGPRTPRGHSLWYGVAPSTSFTALAGTREVNGVRVGAPFPIAVAWIRLFLLQDPKFDVTTIDYEDFAWLFSQGLNDFAWIVGSDETNLGALRSAGTKLLSWHGKIDDVLPYAATVRYRERVESEYGGAAVVDEFFRLFTPEGVAHCANGPGPVPVDPLGDLVRWVEQGEAPDTILGRTKVTDGTAGTRNICRYPLITKYKGVGDPKSPDSWHCVEEPRVFDVSSNYKPRKGWKELKATTEQQVIGYDLSQ